jgi:hypothetical protein
MRLAEVRIWMHRVLLTTLALAASLTLMPATVSAWTPPSGLLLHDGFDTANGPNNLITNEYAAWRSWDLSAVDSLVWQSDGGSLFSVPATGPDGTSQRVAYTGPLDSEAADRYSEVSTHSNKMRFWTRASGFENVRVGTWIKPLGWGVGVPSTWGGFKFYLRREQGVTESPFYTAEPYIYDGHAYIQKKCADGSTHLLAQTRTAAAPIGSWQAVAASSYTNADGSVTIALYRGGALLLQAIDRGTGCAPLTGGHVGFRSDFFSYLLEDFDVVKYPPVATEPPPPPPPPPPPKVLLFDGFDTANGPNNLITNEYAAWHSWDSSAVDSPVWQSDGGSLFSVPATGPEGTLERVAYTGTLDDESADRYSEDRTHSDKMRFWTRASGFENVRVAAWSKPLGWGVGVPSSWGGFKFYLRRELGETESSFYTAEPFIYNGHLYIQKKCVGDTGGGTYSTGGTYYLLANRSDFSVPLGSWRRIAATTRTNWDGSVTISLYRDGVLLLRAVDRGIRADGTGCPPLTGGRVGFRSDFFRYLLDDFEVAPLG